MVTIEELILKLGLDHDPVTKNAYKAERAIEQIGATTHKSFLHGTSAAKGFHKVMEELRTQSPLLGSALNMVLNPLGGSLAAVGLAFAGVKKWLDDWNADMDKMRDKSAAAVGESYKLAEAIKAEADAIEKASRAFDAAERAKNAPTALGTIQAGAATIDARLAGPTRDAARRRFLEASRPDLLRKIEEATRAREQAERDAKAPSISHGIASADAMISQLSTEVAELEKGRAADQEIIARTDIGVIGKRQPAMERLDRLERAKQQLAGLRARRTGLGEVDTARKEELKSRMATLQSYLDQLRGLDAEINKLPAAPFIPTAAQRANLMGPWQFEQFGSPAKEANALLRQIARDVADKGVKIEDVRIP